MILSLSNISILTLHASITTGQVDLRRFPRAPLQLEQLILIMDIDHMDPVEDNTSAYSSEDYKHYGTPEIETPTKATFRPDLSLLHILNPRQLIIQALSFYDPQGDQCFIPFFIKLDTARIISSWRRLRILHLKNALLYTTMRDSPEEYDHEVVPSPFRFSPLVLSRVVHVHLSPHIHSDLPMAEDVYTHDDHRLLLQYFSETLTN